MPQIMLASVEYFIANEVSHPDLIKLIASGELNPEPVDFYNHQHAVDPSVPYDQREQVSNETCPRKSKEEATQTLTDFNPTEKPLVAEMYSIMNQQLGFEKLCMLEVFHCMQAYCAVIVSS